LASASDNQTIMLWNVTTHQQLGKLTGYTNIVRI
jgi:WD40 repeat protein